MDDEVDDEVAEKVVDQVVEVVGVHTYRENGFRVGFVVCTPTGTQPTIK